MAPVETTTLRMLYSLLPPDEGEIRIDGLDPTKDAMAIKTTLGVVPDSRGLYNRLTARENIQYFGELHNLSKQTVEERIESLAQHSIWVNSSIEEPRVSLRVSA